MSDYIVVIFETNEKAQPLMSGAPKPEDIMVVFCCLCGEEFTVTTKEELEGHIGDCLNDGPHPKPANGQTSDGLTIDITIS